MKKPEPVASDRNPMAQAALIAAGHLMQGTYRPDEKAQSVRLVRLAHQILDAWAEHGEPKAPVVED